MLRKSNHKLLLTLLIAGGLLLACAGPAIETAAPSSPIPPAESTAASTTDLAEVEQTLSQMEATWQAQGQADYRFQFRWECFCLPGYREPVWVTVRVNEIESVRAVEPNPDVTLPDVSEYRTVPGLFDLIRDAIERDAYRIEVEYDEAMGYPTSAYIDYEENVVDEERGFHVSEFEILE